MIKDTEEALTNGRAVEIPEGQRCIKRYVMNAVEIVKSHLSQAVINLFYAAAVSRAAAGKRIKGLEIEILEE